VALTPFGSADDRQKHSGSERDSPATITIVLTVRFMAQTDNQLCRRRVQSRAFVAETASISSNNFSLK
jgi:hypothetical protein